MTAFDADGARKFDDMTAHDVQVALAEELNAVSAEDEEEAAVEISDDEIDDVEAEIDDEGDEAEGEDASHPDDPVWTAQQMAEHLRMLEALLFAAADPLDKSTISRRLPEGADIPSLIEALSQHYENRGVMLSKAGGKYRFVTNPEVAHVLREDKVEPRKLSRAALETLAIIAYHQPCTRADIEDVRGVAVSKGSLDQLMEIGWVRPRGRRRDVPGRPVLYATTASFLEHFNLESVGDLPGMADLMAAGLLDARLPPGFSVPNPSDAPEGEDMDDGEDDAEFVQDFHEDGADVEPDAEAARDLDDA